MDKTKAIKRINERLAVYQRQGLTDSAKYNKIVEKIKLLDIPYNERNGKFSISTKKADLDKINIEDIKIIDSMPALKEERKQARERGYKTTQEQNKYIGERGKFEQWAEKNIDYVYIDARSGFKYAEELENLFTTKGKSGNIRHTDYSKIFDLIRKYEQEKETLHKELNNSNFHSDDIFGE